MGNVREVLRINGDHVGYYLGIALGEEGRKESETLELLPAAISLCGCPEFSCREDLSTAPW